ncbi:MAG: DEAD/DEAH box helicase [Alphaproteobacteria bacterium]|nr:DEAD/DEAH box helicase [Alphaproteobacteria bacterium]
MSFETLGLNAELLRAITESGYTTPTPIQEQAIPVVLGGKDVMGIAQTGTGKTAGFTLPMIQRLSTGRAKARMPRSLILEPTRELAAQVAESFEKYGKYHKLNMALLIGGVSYEDQDAKITRGVDVLIATPGRLLDHFERGKLLLNGVQILVVDEADRMLDMGFIPDIEKICKLLPFTRQTLFFSATMPPEITRLADQFLSAPVRIEVARPASTASTIEQKIVTLSSTDPKLKREALRRVIRSQTVSNGIIFCNRKVDVDIVWKSLSKHGFSVAALHGDLPQSVRTATLDKFRAGEVQLLVASDVAARGLDIPAVSHVFNFDVPIHPDDYVHRIGRTGRAGRQGHAFMLAGPRDAKFVDAIESLTKKTIDRDDMTDLHVEPDTRQRGGRDRDQGRGDRQRGGRERDRGRGRHREDRPRHDRVASTEPFDASLAVVTPVEDVAPAAPEAAPRPQRAERQARPRNERRRDRGERPEGGKPPREREGHERKERDRPAPQREKQAPRERNRREGGGDEGPAASFSENLPAFLARPVPQHLLRRKKESEVA